MTLTENQDLRAEIAEAIELFEETSDLLRENALEDALAMCRAAKDKAVRIERKLSIVVNEGA